MSTLGTMIGRIRDDLNRGVDFDVRIRRAIVDAIEFYRNSRLGFNVKRAYAVLTSGREYVSLPTDWVEADFLRLEEDGRRFPMDEVSYDVLEDINQDADTRARPDRYAIHHRELRLCPIPDRSYTLMLSYQFKYTDVSASSSDGASNPWLTEAEELIRKHAMSDLYILYVDGPDAREKGLLLREECSSRILPVLESAAAREQSSGRLRGSL